MILITTPFSLVITTIDAVVLTLIALCLLPILALALYNLRKEKRERFNEAESIQLSRAYDILHNGPAELEARALGIIMAHSDSYETWHNIWAGSRYISEGSFSHYEKFEYSKSAREYAYKQLPRFIGPVKERDTS